MYGLDQSFSIDGTYAGNETRFINHAPKQKANGKVASECLRPFEERDFNLFSSSPGKW